MKKFFSIVAAALVALSMSAKVVEFTPADFEGQGTESSGSAVSATKDGVTVSCDKAFGHSLALRCYKNSVLTVSATEEFTTLVFQFYSTYTGGLNETIAVGATSWTNTMGSQARVENLKVYIGETPGVVTIDTISVSQAVARIAAGQTGKCYVYGRVTDIDLAYLSQGTVNCLMVDLENETDTIKGYKMAGANNAKYYADSETEYAVGDTVLFYANKLELYNTTNEINGGYFVEVLGAGDGPRTTMDTLTVAEAMTLGNSLAAGGVSDKVCVMGYIVKAYAYGEKFAGAQTGYMADQVGAFGEFQLYNCNVPAPGFAEGDQVVVVGKITKYVSADGTKTTIEIKSGDVEVISAAAIEDIESAAKATKVIENGQMVIIRNGVRFNAAGARL